MGATNLHCNMPRMHPLLVVYGTKELGTHMRKNSAAVSALYRGIASALCRGAVSALYRGAFDWFVLGPRVSCMVPDYIFASTYLQTHRLCAIETSLEVVFV